MKNDTQEQPEVAPDTGYITGQVGNILVLGCAGFIGSHLMDRLMVNPDYQVVGWDLHSNRIQNHLNNPKLTFRMASIDDSGKRRELDEDIKNADLVINLAAICNPSQYNTEPLRTIYANFIDNVHVVELATKHQKPIIHYSTSEVYGRTIASYLHHSNDFKEAIYRDPDLFELDTQTTPLIMGPIANQRWTYACAKQLYERLVYAYHAEQGLRFAIVRPFNFFGPRMDFLPGIEGEGKPRVLAIFIANLLLGKPLELVDGGYAQRTITSIHDAIDALMTIIERPAARVNHIYNIGNPSNEISMRDLANMAREVMAEVSGQHHFVDHPIVEVTGENFYGPGYEDCDRRIMSIEKERRILGWEPKIPVREILRETADHYWRLYGKSSYQAAE